MKTQEHKSLIWERDLRIESRMGEKGRRSERRGNQTNSGSKGKLSLYSPMKSVKATPAKNTAFTKVAEVTKEDTVLFLFLSQVQLCYMDFLQMVTFCFFSLTGVGSGRLRFSLVEGYG